jgi:predicted transcriptional regulator
MMSMEIRLEDDLDKRLGSVASALDQPKAWAIEQAVRDFVETQEWQIAAIKEGMRDADAGRTIDHADVAAWVRSWGTDKELPRPTSD